VEEISAVRVYLGQWRSSAAVFDDVTAEDAAADTVENRLTQDLHDAVHPWPAIEAQPAEAWCDGRFVKAFPLEFPMGVADLHQERLRSDFSAAAWAQHLFRYFDGRFLRSSRGHRVIWAVFNTVLREHAHGVGSVVHKNTDQEVLTKERLQQLVAERQDLVRQVASFGAEVPTTPLHWKREGHHLEWCVRQLSWLPPWVASDDVDVCELARSAVRRAGAGEPRGEELDAAPSLRSEPASDDETSVASRVDSLADDDDDAVVEPSGSATEPAPATPLSRPARRATTPRESPGQRAFAGDVDPSHPRRLWRRQAAKVCRDQLGCGRTPAFWFTLNAPYNALHDIHRFHAAVRALALAGDATAPVNVPGVQGSDAGAASAFVSDVRRRRAAGVAWVRENPDIVAFVHALRVELQVR
jgi:hypothetical protein